jgi:hypothetical protein
MAVFDVGQNHDLSLKSDRFPRCEFMDWFICVGIMNNMSK